MNDDVPNFWNKDKASEDYRLPVKILFEGLEQPVIFLMKRNMSYAELSRKIGTSNAMHDVRFHSVAHIYLCRGNLWPPYDAILH